MNRKNNVRILGAGPSGMAAAIALRRSGYGVTVLEYKKRPGERFNNGWQILENYSTRTDALQELQSAGISTDFFYTARNSVDFCDYRLRRYPFSGSEPFGYFIKRGPGPDTLDSSLHAQAVQAGVDIRYNIKAYERDADIVASGAPFATGISKEFVFDSDTEDTLITILDDYLTPLGFSYLFIIGGRGTIGAAVLKDFRHIGDYAESVVLRFRQLMKFEMRNVRESVSSVGFFLPHTAREDSRLYIGEAAGFQDVLFGLGIRRSVQSGLLAARSIAENMNFDELWRKEFGYKLESGILNRFLYERAGNRGYSLLMRAGRHFDFRKIGYRLHNPSFLRLSAARLVRTLWKTNTDRTYGPRSKWSLIRS